MISGEDVDEKARPAFLSAELRAHLDKLTDAQVVALVLFGEARSEPVEGAIAVANVIRNRVTARRWFGADYREVCLKPWQFSCLSKAGGEENYERVLAFANHMASGAEVRDPFARQSIGVAYCIMHDYFLDNVKHATSYHVATMLPRPSWARDVPPVKQIHGHVFYVV